ncbi:hypothetical protein Bint_1655 [Brachyspira intermedia PWS/A]|uniref:Uncharacterized protein n=2 Tax=Brachyspira intermedia TaxID=84377 RepID=G0EIS2_BRAIP|nr:hypothetical protein Bint_1655 [Brachyspira intermedia PWS/A]
MSCKKVNLLGPNNIPPPTAFPIIDDEKPEIPDYPDPTPVPDPPDEGDIEEKPIEVKPEVVPNGTVFGGYGRRFKFKNDWYVLATNEYEYNPETKMLRQLNKGAVLRIEKDGKTITKIYSLKLGDNLEQAEYWTNLNSKKLIIEANKVLIPSNPEQKAYGYDLYEVKFEKLNFDSVICLYPYYPFGVYSNYTIDFISRESDSLINWAYSANREKKTYNIPQPNKDNPTIQGRYGVHGLTFSSLFYLNGRLFLFVQESPMDTHPEGYRDPSAPKFFHPGMRYYSVDVNKDTSDNNNWVEHEFPLRKERESDTYIWYYKNKLYVFETLYIHYYEYNKNNNLWSNAFELAADATKRWSTEDGINWKEEKDVDFSKLKIYKTIDNYTVPLLSYEPPDGTPLEPSYTELNGKYYRTFNSTYPMPPIKEIMETVDRFETNFTVTEEHIKKSGYYQLQVSSVPPDKAQESDWVNVVPNNQTTSSIGWESGGADLFTFNNKIVRLVDYDRQFKLNTQYETALNLSQKYYALLQAAKTMEDYKKYDYYFLYYKAMADMLKIIKDNGSDYFRPDEAVTHYTFEIN